MPHTRGHHDDGMWCEGWGRDHRRKTTNVKESSCSIKSDEEHETETERDRERERERERQPGVVIMFHVSFLSFFFYPHNIRLANLHALGYLEELGRWSRK